MALSCSSDHPHTDTAVTGSTAFQLSDFGRRTRERLTTTGYRLALDEHNQLFDSHTRRM